MAAKLDRWGNIESSGQGAAGVKAHAEIMTAQIRATVVMRLGLYSLAGIFLITAALLIVFAPIGRETATSFVAAALVALAMGSAGYGAFSFRAGNVSLTGNSGERTRVRKTGGRGTRQTLRTNGSPVRPAPNNLR